MEACTYIRAYVRGGEGERKKKGGVSWMISCRVYGEGQAGRVGIDIRGHTEFLTSPAGL